MDEMEILRGYVAPQKITIFRLPTLQKAGGREPRVEWLHEVAQAQILSNRCIDPAISLDGPDAMEFVAHALLQVARRIREQQRAIETTAPSEQTATDSQNH